MSINLKVRVNGLPNYESESPYVGRTVERTIDAKNLFTRLKFKRVPVTFVIVADEFSDWLPLCCRAVALLLHPRRLSLLAESDCVNVFVVRT